VAQRLSGKNEKINEIKKTRVRSPPRATSEKNVIDLAGDFVPKCCDFCTRKNCFFIEIANLPLSGKIV
jgi:hypothetical protein